MFIETFGKLSGEKFPKDIIYIMSTETNSTIESETSNASLNPNTTDYTGKKQRASLKIRKYRGLRKPRSNDPALWEIYNEVHGKGQREKRLTRRPKVYADYTQGIPTSTAATQ